MHHVHFLFSAESAELYRRTVPAIPHERGGFRFDENVEASEGWLVFSDPKCTEMTTAIPHSRRVLVVNEPSPMGYLPSRFVNQFGVLVSPYMIRGYRGFWFQSHPGLPWLFGAEHQDARYRPTLSHQQLIDLTAPAKSDVVSAIVSNKVVHEGHRRRLRFLQTLKRRLGSRLVVFGRGIREIKDKAEAIMPYAYHLALENTKEPSYWSEKLADAYLGYSLPIYAGCQDIDRWLPSESMLSIDVNRPDISCDRIIEALELDMHAARLPEICEARRRILRQESIFDVVARAISASPCSEPNSAKPEQIRSIPRPGLVRRVRRELRRSYHQLTFRISLNEVASKE